MALTLVPKHEFSIERLVMVDIDTREFDYELMFKTHDRHRAENELVYLRRAGYIVRLKEQPNA